MSGDLGFRQHDGGHPAQPNWPYFLEFASRYLHAPVARAHQLRPDVLSTSMMQWHSWPSLSVTRHSELFGSGFDEAKAPVDGKQLRAKAEDGDVDRVAAFCAEVIFGCGEHLFAESGALVGGVDCEHAEVAAIAVGFCVDAGEDLASTSFRRGGSRLSASWRRDVRRRFGCLRGRFRWRRPH